MAYTNPAAYEASWAAGVRALRRSLRRSPTSAAAGACSTLGAAPAYFAGSCSILIGTSKSWGSIPPHLISITYADRRGLGAPGFRSAPRRCCPLWMRHSTTRSRCSYFRNCRMLQGPCARWRGSPVAAAASRLANGIWQGSANALAVLGCCRSGVVRGCGWLSCRHWHPPGLPRTRGACSAVASLRPNRGEDCGSRHQHGVRVLRGFLAALPLGGRRRSLFLRAT